MKKVIVMSLMALAISVSADAKTASKAKHLTKPKRHMRSNATQFSCVGGMTSCGTTYMHCDDSKDFPSDEENLAIWEFEDQWACGN